MTTESSSSSTTLVAPIPTTMKRLVVIEPGKDVASCKIQVQNDVPVPTTLKSGQVLIRVVAAAINPSDYGSWINARIDQCPLPMGKEGSGIIVQIANDIKTKLLTTAFGYSIGTQVGFVGLHPSQGAYSEYIVADILQSVFQIPTTVPIQDAASFFVNPYTAIGILDTVQNVDSTAKAFVHTAAASQLGQMLVKLAPSVGIDVINVVRRQDQADILKQLGAKHIIISNDNDESWKEELKAKVQELNAKVAFDAVAGRSTGDLLDCLPSYGTVYVYGGLAGRVSNINPIDLIYQHKQVTGFYLVDWIQNGGKIQALKRLLYASKQVNAGLTNNGWSSTQFQDTTIENAQSDTVKLLSTNSTGIKLRIRFDQ